MGDIRTSANDVFRDYEIDGVRASGVREPDKADLRTFAGVVEDRIDQVAAVAEAGLKWTPETIRVRATVNVPLATGLENGDALNGVTLATGDHVFLDAQTDPAENGLYTVVAAGAAARAAFADTAAELEYLAFLVLEGTTGAGERWTLPMAASDITLGTTPLVFSRVGAEVDVSGIVAGMEPTVTAMSASFTPAVTDNLANPAEVDSNLPTLASQLHRVRNAGGALSAQSPTTLGTFAVERQITHGGPVPHVAHIHNTPLDWAFYMSPVRLDFFNADGSFHSSQTSGFTVNGGAAPTAGMAGVRQLEFTPPEGSERWAPTYRNFGEFSNSFPVTAEALQVVSENLMLSVGGEPVEFAPYVEEGALEIDPALLDSGSEKPITIALQGGFAYIRTAFQQSATKDVVWRVRYGAPPDYDAVNNRTGALDFFGIREIDRTTATDATIAAFNQSTQLHSAGMDESAADRFDGMFQLGGHGFIGYEVTKAAHGMTAEDVGSIWEDTAGDDWVLYLIVSTSKLLFLRRYTGTTTAWVMSSAAPTGSTFTHVSGATHTGDIAFTGPSQKQMIPAIRNYAVSIVLDGETLSEDAVYRGVELRIPERYEGMNLASQQDDLIAKVGSASPDYTSADIDTHVSVEFVHTWNRWGAYTGYYTRTSEQAAERRGGSTPDYFGGLQLQRLSLVGDSTAGKASSVWFYVPNIAPVGGVDYEAVADVTANASDVFFPTASCDDPADPASHFAMIGKDGSNVPTHGVVWGLARVENTLGDPDVRAVSVEYVASISPAEKGYLRGKDGAAGNQAAGDVDNAIDYRAPYLIEDPDLTIPAPIISVGAKYHAPLAVHTALTRKWVAVPRELIGLPVVALKTDPNVTVHTPFVQSRGIMVSVTGSYGDVVLEIG